MKILKQTALLLAVLMLAMALYGCVTENDYPPALVLRDQTPPERDENADSGTFETELFFLSQDDKSLKKQTRVVEYDTQTSRAEAAIQALISGPETDPTGIHNSVPSLFRVNRVELCGDVCNVYFEGDSFIPTETEWLRIRAAVAATVAAAEGINSVNVFLFERQLGYYNYSLGTMSPLEEELSVYLRNMSRTYSYLNTAESGVNIVEDTQYGTQSIALYFANTEGTLLSARNAEISYPEGIKKTQLIEMIVEQLSGGDTEGTLEPSLPADFKLLQEPTVIYSGKTEDGREDTESDCIVELVIAQPEAANYNETLMCGALTMTISSFIPNVSGVRILIAEETQQTGQTPSPEENDQESGITVLRVLGEKAFRNIDFTDLLGHTVNLYYPDEDGLVLRKTSRIIPQTTTYDPLVRLQELLSNVSEQGMSYAPFTADDIQDVYVVDGVAVIDWAPGFSETLRAYLENDSTMEVSRRESMFIYGVVNTMTDMPMISSVWMLEDGKKIEKIQNIYLGSALVRNPGLIVEE